MSFMKLNNNRVRWEMTRLRMRPADLAERLGISPPMARYLMNKGGVRYADLLAEIFGCTVESLLMEKGPVLRMPKGYSIRRRRVHVETD